MAIDIADIAGTANVAKQRLNANADYLRLPAGIKNEIGRAVDRLVGSHSSADSATNLALVMVKAALASIAALAEQEKDKKKNEAQVSGDSTLDPTQLNKVKFEIYAKAFDAIQKQYQELDKVLAPVEQVLEQRQRTRLTDAQVVHLAQTDHVAFNNNLVELVAENAVRQVIIDQRSDLYNKGADLTLAMARTQNLAKGTDTLTDLQNTIKALAPERRNEEPVIRHIAANLGTLSEQHREISVLKEQHTNTLIFETNYRTIGKDCGVPPMDVDKAKMQRQINTALKLMGLPEDLRQQANDNFNVAWEERASARFQQQAREETPAELSKALQRRADIALEAFRSGQSGRGTPPVKDLSGLSLSENPAAAAALLWKLDATVAEVGGTTLPKKPGNHAEQVNSSRNAGNGRLLGH